jgi:hypothetical protein
LRIERKHAIAALIAAIGVGVGVYFYRLAALEAASAATLTVSSAAAPAFAPLTVGATSLLRGDAPLHLNGDAAWSLLVVPTEAEAFSYLHTRREQQFNAVLVNLVEHYAGGPRNRRGDAPFENRAFVTPNELYFQHVDSVLREAARQDIVVLLAPAYVGYGCGNEGWCAELRKTPDTILANYGEYLGRRYRGFNNVVWVHGGDADARRFGLSAKVAAIARGIRRAQGTQLHTAHCARNQSGGECYSDLQLDFDTAYASCSTTAPAIDAMRHRAVAMPFIYIEGTYENMKDTPGCLRDQLLRSMLGGASGHIFGNQPVWEFAEGWQTQLRSPGSRMMSKLWPLLAPLRAAEWSSTPDGSIQQDQNGSNQIVASSISGLKLVYAPASTELMLTPTLAKANVCWYDLDRAERLAKRGDTDQGGSTEEVECEQVAAGAALVAPRKSDWLVSIAPLGRNEPAAR